MELVHPSVPSDDQLVAIRELVADRARADGREPLSDQALTQVGSRAVQHVLAVDDGVVVGYAQRDNDSLEMVAGDHVAATLLGEFDGQPVRVWTHGEHSTLLDGLRSAASPVLARITRDAVARLGLLPGGAVFAVIKAGAFDHG